MRCKTRFTLKDEQQGQIVMLQSTECFHMIHSLCFKDHAMKCVRGSN